MKTIRESEVDLILPWHGHVVSYVGKIAFMTPEGEIAGIFKSLEDLPEEQFIPDGYRYLEIVSD